MGTPRIVMLALCVSLAACSRKEATPTPTREVTSVRDADAGPIQRDAGPDAAKALVDADGGSLASPCPTVMEPARLAEPLPPLDRNPNLPLLVQEGRAGHPRRVRLRFHNPVSDCLCPPLSVTDDAKEGPVLLPSAVFATFPKPLANGNNFDGSRYHGHTIYVMTGYFSGRLVDRFEWSRREYGFETSIDELESADTGDWQTRYPEFCVESWCVIPDPKPGSAGFMHKPNEYSTWLTRMRAAGVAFCQGEDRQAPAR